MTLDARKMDFTALNEAVRQSGDARVELSGVCGQRYIGSGLSGREIKIEGTPGNALGAYLNGSEIRVHGNAQDATGDTMNSGRIYIYGSAGDACGYAMRGGRILIRGNAGYRAGIHMKAYGENRPVLVIGGRSGDFLGEYQAGGVIVVLGIGQEGCCVGPFCGTGMHGGKIILWGEPPRDLPRQVEVREATEEDMKELTEYVREFCGAFGHDEAELLSRKYCVLEPNSKNPYHRLYTQN